MKPAASVFSLFFGRVWKERKYYPLWSHMDPWDVREGGQLHFVLQVVSHKLAFRDKDDCWNRPTWNAHQVCSEEYLFEDTCLVKADNQIYQKMVGVEVAKAKSHK